MTPSPGHQALRKGRISLPGHVYLLTTTTANRQPLFLDLELAHTACQHISRAEHWGDASLLCWVLMPDHWHGLVRLGERDNISLVMNRFKSVTSKRLCQLHAGRIWATGFHDRTLRKDEDVIAAARYIVANPLRAGLVSRANDYPYWDCVWL